MMRPVLRRRLPHREGGGQDRGQDQAGEFNGAMRLWPLREPQEHAGSYGDRGKHNEGRIAGAGPHSGLGAELDGLSH